MSSRTASLNSLEVTPWRQAGEQQVAEEQGQPVKPASIGRAALAAAGQTGLDIIGFEFFKPAFKALPFVGKLFGKERAEVAKEAGDQLADAFAKRAMRYGDNIVKGVGKGISFEMPQEVAQQALERWQAGLSLADEDARREYGEAMAGAMVLGGGLGTLQGVVETHNAHEEAKQVLNKKETKPPSAASSARRKKRLKRGGDMERVEMDGVDLSAPMPDDDLLALDEALDRLAAVDPRAAELVKLCFFVELTQEQAANELGISISTVERTWAYARAWLFREIRKTEVR